MTKLQNAHICDFAVFKCNGEDTEQITVWMNEEKIKAFVLEWRLQHPDDYFVVMQRHDF